MELSWEKILTKATQDVQTYLQALMLWSEPTEKYSADYILLLALTNRARVRKVLTLIENGNIPSGYDGYKKQLITLWSEAERLLEVTIFRNAERVQQVLSNEFIQRLDSMEDDLKNVRRLSQEGAFTGDYEWISDELRETAHNFLLSFRDMALTNDELQQSPLKGTKEYNTFKQTFTSIENQFKKYFGYFHLVSDLIVAINEREYKMKYWWLNEIPLLESIVDEEIPQDLIKKLRDVYQSAKKSTLEQCKEVETLMAYALGELPLPERIRMRSHILQCRLCLDLVTDVRYAEAASKDMEEASEAYKDFFEKVRTKLIQEQETLIPSFQDLVRFLTGIILVQQIQIRALQRRPAYGETQMAPELLEVKITKKINLKLKKDERGKYTLPHTPEQEYCDSIEDYRKINDFIKEAKTYWGGFALRNGDTIKEFQPDLIRDLSLSRIIKLDPEQNYKAVIIGIAGERETLQRGLDALRKKDEKTISSLDVVWLICSLE